MLQLPQHPLDHALAGCRTFEAAWYMLSACQTLASISNQKSARLHLKGALSKIEKGTKTVPQPNTRQFTFYMLEAITNNAA